MARKSKKTEYPKMFYGPDGVGKVFQKEDEVPEGFVDHPSLVGKDAPKKAKRQTAAQKKAADKKAADKKAAEAKTDDPTFGGFDVTREEALTELAKEGVALPDDAPDEEVIKALNETFGDGK